MSKDRRYQKVFDDRSERRRRSSEDFDSRPSRPYSFGSSRDSIPFGKYVTLGIKYSFYAVMFFIFSLVFLIVLQALGFKTFSFLPDDGGLIPVPLLPTNRQIAFSKTRTAADASANLVNLVSSNYTVSLDVLIESDFVNQSVPRVLLYRSANSFVLGTSEKSIEDIILKMPQTNFVLYLDPYKNDLMVDLIFAGRQGPSGNGPSTNGPSGDPTRIRMPPIQNVPIRKPFRITMMLSDSLLEIYINGELQKSVPFVGKTLVAVPEKGYFYGPPLYVGGSVLVSNISYWNTPLTSHAIRTYGKEEFNTTVLVKK